MAAIAPGEDGSSMLPPRTFLKAETKNKLFSSLAVRSVTDLTDAIRGCSTITVLRQQAELKEDLLALQSFSSLLDEHLHEIVKTRIPSEKMVILMRFAKRCEAVGGFTVTLLRLLAQDVDAHFAPLPTMNMIDKVKDGFGNLGANTFEGVTFTHLGRAQRVDEFLKPGSEIGNARLLLEERGEDVNRAVVAALQQFLDEVHRLADGDFMRPNTIRFSTIQAHFSQCLLRTISDGNYRVFTRAGAFATPDELELTCMPWLALGWNLFEVSPLLTEVAYMGDRSSTITFSKLDLTVLPQFAGTVAELRDVMKVRIEAADWLRAKILASLVSVCIVGANAGFSYIQKLAKEDV